MKIHPSNVVLPADFMVELYQNLDHYEKALGMLDTQETFMRQNHPDPAYVSRQISIHRGFLHHRHQIWERAIANYRHVIAGADREDSNYLYHVSQLLDCYARDGQMEKAADLYRKTIGLIKENHKIDYFQISYFFSVIVDFPALLQGNDEEVLMQLLTRQAGILQIQPPAGVLSLKDAFHYFHARELSENRIYSNFVIRHHEDEGSSLDRDIEDYMRQAEVGYYRSLAAELLESRKS